jgi:hypothetical protein
MLKTSRMPQFYRAPLGLPFYWRDEISGELTRAVMAYLNWGVNGQQITEDQVELVADYLSYWVNAPCWDQETFEEEIAALRAGATKLKTPEGINAWIHKALEIAADPL